MVISSIVNNPLGIRFEIELIYHTWSCGDNCCSDSGYKCFVFDTLTREHVYYSDDWEFNHNKDTVLQSALEAIEEQLGRFPTLNDYILNETCEYEGPTETNFDEE